MWDWKWKTRAVFFCKLEKVYRLYKKILDFFARVQKTRFHTCHTKCAKKWILPLEYIDLHFKPIFNKFLDNILTFILMGYVFIFVENNFCKKKFWDLCMICTKVGFTTKNTQIDNSRENCMCGFPKHYRN